MLSQGGAGPCSNPGSASFCMCQEDISIEKGWISRLLTLKYTST